MKLIRLSRSTTRFSSLLSELTRCEPNVYPLTDTHSSCGLCESVSRTLRLNRSRFSFDKPPPIPPGPPLPPPRLRVSLPNVSVALRSDKRGRPSKPLTLSRQSPQLTMCDNCEHSIGVAFSAR